MANKYTGAEPMFDDPDSPYNGVPTAELMKLYDEQVAKEKAERFYRKLDPKSKESLAQRFTPKTDTLVDNPNPDQTDKPKLMDSWPWEPNKQ